MKKILKFFVTSLLILTLTTPMHAYAAPGDLPAQTTAAISFEEALQQALMLYINSGLDQNSAMVRLQAILPQLMANPAAFLQIVQADLAALGIASGVVPAAVPSVLGASVLQAQQAAAIQAQQQAAIQAQQQAAIEAQQAEILRQQEIFAQQQAAQAQFEAQQAELLRQQQVAAVLQAQQQQTAQVRINPSGAVTYIGNSNSRKFHYPTCSSVLDMAAHNVVPFYGDRSEPIGLGYVPCKRCHP